ncbi:hypothetical protein D9757_011704 [Collybiopsis confluens]|uniref:Integrase core domain-containing protein n=1 Tax=Collybiopsis confluens TaxID=2823264 RepID=A0A8H5GM40_9AGAR|nr:hypothetical protein D9757_011704 [Collybiopsis confluens]
MACLPSLPPTCSNGHCWSDNVQEALSRITSIYSHATALLLQEADPTRLQIHLERVVGEAVPLLAALEASDDNLSADWLEQCTTLVADLANNLSVASDSARSTEDALIVIPEPVTEQRRGGRGRPKKNINVNFLHEAMDTKRRISLVTLAHHIGVSQRTLVRRLQEAGVFYKYSSISNRELDALVRSYRRVKPNAGLRYIIGYLRSHGFRIQTKSMQRVDRLGNMLHQKPKIKRRKYSVKRPNALWHVDGHHKLILWGIVIHGIIDGYCRTITGLRASTNNRASTVLEVFVDAIDVFGHPSRMRGDRGRENKAIAIYMILRNGLNRGSFIWGSSTHNTRIERLWVEVGSQFARRWRAFFYRLEHIHLLNRKNPSHLWLIHYLFLDIINNDCNQFQNEWNVHPISGEEGKDESPHDKRWLGMVKHGVYTDDCDGLDVESIEELYGTTEDVPARPSNHTGAGYLNDEDVPEYSDGNSDTDSDESDLDLGEIDKQIEATSSNQFLPKAIKPPRHSSPFNDEELHLFEETLEAAVHANITPVGYGIHPDEWEDSIYPTIEMIRTGRKGGREISVQLPDHIWPGNHEDICGPWDLALWIVS